MKTNRLVTVLSATLLLGSGMATWAACGTPFAPTVYPGGACTPGCPQCGTPDSCSPDVIAGGGCFDDGVTTAACTAGPTNITVNTWYPTVGCQGGCIGRATNFSTTAGVAAGTCSRG